MHLNVVKQQVCLVRRHYYQEKSTGPYEKQIIHEFNSFDSSALCWIFEFRTLPPDNIQNIRIVIKMSMLCVQSCRTLDCSPKFQWNLHS